MFNREGTANAAPSLVDSPTTLRQLQARDIVINTQVSRLASAPQQMSLRQQWTRFYTHRSPQRKLMVKSCPTRLRRLNGVKFRAVNMHSLSQLARPLHCKLPTPAKLPVTTRDPVIVAPSAMPVLGPGKNTKMTVSTMSILHTLPASKVVS
jgi:hypothetical protein